MTIKDIFRQMSPNPLTDEKYETQYGGHNMSHRSARQTIAKNKARLEKHFSEDPGFELDKQTIQRLQYEIEQAEMLLDEAEEEGDWHHGDVFG